MDKEKVNSILRQTAASVLENASFVFIDEDEVDSVAKFDNFTFIGGTIGFRGPYNGKVVMYMVEQTVDLIARNLLGIDDDDVVSAQHRNDALKEILNMITGNLLTSLYDDSLVFDLEIPKLLSQNRIPEDLSETSIIMYSEMVPIIISLNEN